MIFLELIYNLSLLVSLSIVSGFVDKRFPRVTLNGRIIQGFLFGIVAMVGMMKPLVFSPGLIFDGRSVVISLCALFFGPLSGIIAGSISIIFRITQGGVGIIMGVLVVISSVGIGIYFHPKKIRSKTYITAKQLLFFGLFVHTAMLIMAFSLPFNTAVSVLQRIGIPIILCYPLATVLIGKILSDQEMNLKNIETIKANEIKFRTAVDFTYNWEYWKGENGEIIYCSPSCEKITGYTQNEFISDPGLVDRIVYPDDSYLFEMHQKHLDSIERRFESAEIEFRIKRKDNALVNISHACRPVFDENMNYLGRRISNRDITGRKRAEEELKASETKFRSIAETLSDVIFMTDRQGTITFISPSSGKIFGYEPGEMTGCFFGNFVEPDELSRLYPMFEDVIINRVNSINIIISAKRKDGRLFYGELSASVIIDNDTVTGTIGLLRDVTERKMAENELELYRNHLEELVKARTEELDKVNESLKKEIGKQKEYEMMLKKSLEKEKELNELKTRFISTTSHEFRTPLTSILLSADLIQLYGHNWSEEKKFDHLDKIKNSVKYLTKLLDDMLTLSRTESGKISCNPELINLHSLINELTDEAKSLMKENHKLDILFEAGQKEFMLDSKLIRFIVSNLLSNAFKFSPDGGSIQINIFQIETDLVIKVSDPGIGIPQEDLNKIYESFYRTKNAEQMTGTGLGLAIVKRAVDLHNGYITVESELNNGTTFTIKLPQN